MRLHKHSSAAAAQAVFLQKSVLQDLQWPMPEQSYCSQLVAVFKVETDRVPQGDGVTHLPAGYRKMTMRNVATTVDAAEYFATDNTSL